MLTTTHSRLYEDYWPHLLMTANKLRIYVHRLTFWCKTSTGIITLGQRELKWGPGGAPRVPAVICIKQVQTSISAN